MRDVKTFGLYSIDLYVKCLRDNTLEPYDTVATYSDLEGPRDINVWKIASEDPSMTPTAIIAGWSSHCKIYKRLNKDGYITQLRSRYKIYQPLHEILYL